MKMKSVLRAEFQNARGFCLNLFCEAAKLLSFKVDLWDTVKYELETKFKVGNIKMYLWVVAHV